MVACPHRKGPLGLPVNNNPAIERHFFAWRALFEGCYGAPPTKPRNSTLAWFGLVWFGISNSVSAATPQLCPAGRLGRQPTRCGLTEYCNSRLVEARLPCTEKLQCRRPPYFHFLFFVHTYAFSAPLASESAFSFTLLSICQNWTTILPSSPYSISSSSSCNSLSLS
jgi:hypothetical protein